MTMYAILRVSCTSVMAFLVAMEPRQTFGARLRQLRELAGLSQNALARRAKVPQSVIWALEAGQQKSVSLEAAVRIADVLGVSLDFLAGRSTPPRE
jgi:transcriptional regulator with XRE-family HTH domain